MFTGIVQAVGKVRQLDQDVLWIDAPADWTASDPLQIGESVAVSGCCLTITPSESGMRFDVTQETLARTSLGDRKVGDPVNLERAMRPIDRFGGHIVQGHVDGVGEFLSREGEAMRFRVPESGIGYLIDKGSIAIEGVSLTVVRPVGPEFEIWVIPHTLEVTNLGHLAPGAKVNVEFDVLAKHVEKLLARR